MKKVLPDELIMVFSDDGDGAVHQRVAHIYIVPDMVKWRYYLDISMAKYTMKITIRFNK